MYRASIDSRSVGYKTPKGEVDESKEGYERLWKEFGGSEDGRQAWLTAIAGAPQAASAPMGYTTDLVGQGPVARVVYLTTTGHIEELSVE